MLSVVPPHCLSPASPGRGKTRLADTPLFSSSFFSLPFFSFCVLLMLRGSHQYFGPLNDRPKGSGCPVGLIQVRWTPSDGREEELSRVRRFRQMHALSMDWRFRGGKSQVFFPSFFPHSLPLSCSLLGTRGPRSLRIRMLAGSRYA